MSIYALSQRAGETCDAAGKAMQDVFAVLAQKGSKTIWSMPKSCSKYMKILDLPYLACFLLFRAGKKIPYFCDSGKSCEDQIGQSNPEGKKISDHLFYQ